MSKITFTLFFIFITFYNYSQESIEVCDKTFKVSALSEEIFYYGFAESDKMVFSLEEMNGKEIKEVEIAEYPQSIKFSDFKTKKIDNKQITVNKKKLSINL